MTDLSGIILAGGLSVRMQTEKARLNYHGMEQFRYVAKLLSESSKDVHISCRQDQTFDIDCIYDLSELAGIGPAVAWFSVYEKLERAFIILGIDYPLFDEQELKNLIQQRDPQADASVLFNSQTGFYEPMLGIYEWSFYQKLQSVRHEPIISIQTILRSCQVKKVLPLNKNSIISIDHPEQYQSILQTIHEK
jgi:molybdopterin-guanine dinucleotide biosynthesis protein A